METINNMAKAAATAVWGENQTTGTASQEPVSGVQGNTAAGEPFDKGNDETAGTKTTSAGNTTTTGAQTGSSTTTTTTDEGANKSAQFAKNTGTAAEADETPQTATADLKAKDTPTDTTKGQNDVRSPDDPKTNPKNAPTDVNDKDEGVNKAQEPTGPGPAPLDQLASEHGGDAGAVGGDKKTSSGAGADDEDEDGPNAKSKGEGTGEKYVKSSGLVADGGDFDAANPGAGREADRLLEQKGVHVEKPGDKKKEEPAPTSSSKTDKSDVSHKSSASDDKEKTSLKDKIKAKLGRN